MEAGTPTTNAISRHIGGSADLHHAGETVSAQGDGGVPAPSASSLHTASRRSGYVFKTTPSVGGVSPVNNEQNHNDPNDRDGNGNNQEVEGLLFDTTLRRRSTMSKAYTSQEEREVVRKLDRRLVLFLALLYLLSFLDRSNIGNARIAGLETSLSMTSRQFDLCLVAFYLTYITFEWMILLYRVIPPHIYISCCVFAWGIVASLQSVVTGFSQLLALRALLGVTEAAFGPGVPFYMTFFYRRSELAYRVGLQISAAPLAITFASTLAYIIVSLAKFTGLESWRALFLVEGFPSIVTAVVAWYWIPDSPETIAWLTPRERKVANLRLASEGTTKPTSSPLGKLLPEQSRSKLNLSEILLTLKDPKAYLTSLMFLSVNVSFASLPVFLPTIINSMSFSAVTSQILSAPPYLLAFAFVLIVGHYSDKTPDSRSICLCAVSSLSCASYATIALAGILQDHNILSVKWSIIIRYLAVFPAAMGLFASVVLIITWTLNNQASSTGKGMGMVILNVVGQCGPLIGVQLFPRSTAPLYVSGMLVCAAFMGGVAVLSVILRRYLMRLNAMADAGLSTTTGGGGYEMVRLKEGEGGNDPDGLHALDDDAHHLDGDLDSDDDDDDDDDDSDDSENDGVGYTSGRREGDGDGDVDHNVSNSRSSFSRVTQPRQFRFML